MHYERFKHVFAESCISWYRMVNKEVFGKQRLASVSSPYKNLVSSASLYVCGLVSI